MCKLLGLPSDTIFYDNLLEMITERIGCPSRTQALVQLGLLSEEKVERLGTPLDTVSNHLASILSYDSEERDMILMRHEVKFGWKYWSKTDHLGRWLGVKIARKVSKSRLILILKPHSVRFLQIHLSFEEMSVFWDHELSPISQWIWTFWEILKITILGKYRVTNCFEKLQF